MIKIASAFVVREVLDSLKSSPLLVLVLVLNAGMIWTLIYVANAQREERQILTQTLIKNCDH